MAAWACSTGKEALSAIEIKVVYRVGGESANSGVFVRIPIEPREEWMPVHYGFEVQIYNAGDQMHRTGTIYSFTRAKATPERPGPAWNEMIIRLAGARTTVTVNGVLVTDYVDSPAAQAGAPARVSDWEPRLGVRPNKGWIGLQNHWNNDLVYFKEVAIRPIKGRRTK